MSDFDDNAREPVTIIASKEKKFGTARFEISQGDDHHRNKDWPEAFKILLSKGYKDYEIERALRNAMSLVSDDGG